MFNQIQAQQRVAETFPGRPIKSWLDYGDIYLFRIEYLSPAEKDWDPFFSVDKLTGEVRDFSVIKDGNLIEISEAKWNDI